MIEVKKKVFRINLLLHSLLHNKQKYTGILQIILFWFSSFLCGISPISREIKVNFLLSTFFSPLTSSSLSLNLPKERNEEKVVPFSSLDFPQSKQSARLKTQKTHSISSKITKWIYSTSMGNQNSQL